MGIETKSVENNVATKCDYFIIFLFSLLIFIISFTPNFLSVLLYSVLLFFITIINPLYGLVGWVIAVPYEFLLVRHLGYSPFNVPFGYTVSLLVGTVFSFILLKKDKFKLNFEVLFFCFFFLLVGIISTTNSHIYLNELILLGFHLSILLLFTSQINQRGVYLVLFSIVVTSAGITLVALLNSDINSGRLLLESNVRVFMNYGGISIVILILSIIIKQSNIILPHTTILLPFGKNKVYSLLLLFYFILILLMSVSRGVMLAITVTVVLVTILGFLWSNKTKVLNVKVVLFSYTIIVILLFTTLELIDKYLIGGALIGRASMEAGEDLRFQIWNAAISNLNNLEYIFGAGPGMFTSLARMGGLDYYSHSVYIDIFVTMGFVGLIIFLIFMVRVFYLLYKYRCLTGIALYLLLIMMFVTHGSLNSKSFWVLFAIVSTIAYLNNAKYKESN